jgi:predicted ATPase/DNA-binding SARP family transcriptional activator
VTTFDVLGPLRIVATDGDQINLPGHLQRRLLAALLLHRGRVVSVDRLSELVWPDGDAPTGPAALQSLVFRLRQRVPDLEIEFRPPGYVIHIDDHALQSLRFERLLHDAVAERAADPARALAMLDEAVAMWRGDPYDDLVDSDDGRIEIERLGELWLRAIEERFELMIEIGKAGEVVADIEAFVARHPLRERPRQLLIDALDVTGRRADALRVFDAYRRLLAEEIGVAPSVSLRARHDRLLDEDDRHPQSPASEIPPRPRRQSIRRATSTLVGRDQVLAEIERRLATARLLTLIGPGGVGKTRLALEICERLAAGFADGVVFCDLTAGSVDSLVDVVIDAVGIEIRAGQAPIERLEEVMRHEHCLLVFDNCEHVIGAAAAVAERLLQVTERVVIIATSRERLAIDGEQLMPVLPLALEGEGSEAVRLFVDRARAVAPDFTPSADDLTRIGSLCRRLDGLPLAIELAAARLQTLQLDEISEGLDQSLAVLHGGRRTVDRHRSVEAALQWSVDLLEPSHRRALHAAAMFSTAFEAGDVATVLGIDAADGRERLAALVERSLAGRQRSGRFYLLDIVRRFARERIAADEWRSLHAGYSAAIRNTAVRLGAELVYASTSSPIDAFNELAAEFRAVIATSLAGGDVETAITIITSVRDLALNALSPDLMRLGAEVAAAADRIDHPLTADAYAVAGQGAWKRGDLNEMRQLLERATAATERLGIGDRYDVLGTMGTEDLAHGRMLEAVERFERGNATVEASGHPLRLAEGGATLAICMSYAHLPDAIATADRLLEAIVPAGGAVAAAWCYYAAGECRLADDPDAARTLLSQSVEAARAGGSAFVEAVAGASLASLDVRRGDIPAAVAMYRWLLPLWLRAGVRSPFWTAMRWVAKLLLDAGRPEAAAQLLGAMDRADFASRHLGDDSDHMAGMRAAALRLLGAERYEIAAGRGAELDDAAATAMVMAAFDELGPG